MIHLRRSQQYSFGDGLIAEQTSDLWEPWMRQADRLSGAHDLGRVTLAAAVAVENRIAVVGEAPPGVRFPPISAGAQTGSTEAGLAARTEEPGLAGGGRREEAPRGRGQTRRAFPRSDAQTSSIANAKTPYHYLF